LLLGGVTRAYLQATLASIPGTTKKEAEGGGGGGGKRRKKIANPMNFM
jgi:hypothetical protein